MGFSSRICKHCGHSILCRESADPEINEWMKYVVVLLDNGTRIIGEHDGCLSIYSDGIDEVGPIYSSDAVWVHEACWEVAGKPAYEDYDGPSEDAPDQGYNFRNEHDMLDPRITRGIDLPFDEDAREKKLAELLEEAKAKRAKRRFDDDALRVYEWLNSNPGWVRDDKRTQPWRHRFGYGFVFRLDENGDLMRDENGMAIKDLNRWRVRDDLDVCDGEIFEGTREECEAHLADKWTQFVEGDAKAYLARFEGRKEEERAARESTTCSA